jgi:hypothetical protein
MKENSTYHDGLESTNLPESLRENPFAVPEHYFSDLESRIITHVKWADCSDETAFKVPEGYFEALSDRIMGEIAIDALRSQMTRNDFAIPDDYDAVLTANIFHRISEEKLKNEIQTDGFTQPANYEQMLEDSICTRIGVEKLKESIPSDGFALPSEYFDRLSDKIAGSIREREGVKHENTPIRRLGQQKKWYTRYAAAASLVMTLGLAGYWGYQYQSKKAVAKDNMAEQQLSQHLSEIPKQEIINYLAASASGDDIIYMSQYTDESNLPTKGFGTNIPKQDIEDYLKYSL